MVVARLFQLFSSRLAAGSVKLSVIPLLGLAMLLSAVGWAATVAGYTPGSFKVSETGAATYTVPLAVPPGTAGMVPSLSLTYHSQSGNGLLGMGWALAGLSVIHRCPATLVQDGFSGGIQYDANDRYCLDGQRLVAVTGAYGAHGTEYRTERDGYTKIVSYGTAGSGPTHFMAWTKAGQTLEYGVSDDSRIEAQGRADVRVWAVNKMADTKGNYLAVYYNEDNANGDYSPNRIEYTGNPYTGLVPYNAVHFFYEARPDVTPLYEAGSLVRALNRLVSIKTYSSGALVKEYRLTYEQSSETQRSRLTSLTECAADGTTCLPPIAMRYYVHSQASSSTQMGASGGPSAPDLLASITNGLGATTTVTYKPLTDNSVYVKGNDAAYPYLDLQAPLYVVASHASSNGIGGTYTTGYTYGAAKTHLTGGGFLGFSWVIALDGQTGIQTTTYFRQDWPYQGLIATLVKQTGSGVVLNRVDNTWFDNATHPGVYAPVVTRSVEQSRDLHNTALPTRTTDTTYDLYGNATQVTVATSDGDTKTTTNTYRNDPTSWILGRLLRAQVTSTVPGQPSQTRTSSFAYQAGSGLLVQEVIEPDYPALRLVTDYALDAYGNRVRVTVSGADMAPRTSTFTYDAQGRFTVRLVNALGHAETRTYGNGFGHLLSTTGPNGLTTTWTYDGLGRTLRESRPDGTTTDHAYQLCGAAVSCPARAVMSVSTRTSGAPDRAVYVDSLNREVLSTVQGFDGRLIAQATDYDALGRVARVSRPYYAHETPVWATFGYDLLGRVVSETAPDAGVTRTAYEGLRTRVTNALGQTTTQVKNSQGQVIEVSDALGGRTRYAYDPLGNLAQTTDALGNITTLEYDLRGRKIAQNDPDMGRWTYQYNALGEIVRQTDALGQVTTFDYDALGRLLSRSEPDLLSTWVYDTAPKGIGKLAQVSASNGHQRAYTYDVLGRVARVATTIQQTPYTVDTLYDDLGRVEQVIYPTGFAVKRVYNPYGYLAEVRNAATYALFWQANSMSPSGRLVNFTLGNGLVTERRLDLLDRITGLSTGPAGRVQNVSFQYDALGNLTARTDSNQPLDESFSYDALNRLTAAFTSGLPSQSFAYDAIGNLVYKSDVGTYRYGVQPHAVIETQASPAHTPLAYTYDANGNLVSGAGRTITHTSYNLPARIAANGGTTVLEFSYDADHQRFRELRPGGETLYLNPRIDTGLHYEQERRGTLTEHKHYLYAGAEVIGVYIRRSDGIDSTRYFHSDPLGSITAITHETGTVVERLSYDAFGKRRFPTGVDDPGNTLAGHTTHHGFTAHEHLDEVGLIHMNGRVYDPRLGRFLEADPDIQFPFSTQGLNRYSYVDNNPLSRIDPSGYGWLSKTWKKVWRGVKKAARNPVVRAVAAIAVAWYIGPAVTNYLTDVAWNIATATAQPISFAQINTLTYAANAVGGAAGGFASSLVASGGDLQAGLNGAISGGLFGGVNGYFDNQWSLGRVATNGVTGGVAAELTGGDFNKGFVSSFTTSALTYASFTMRDVMIEQSRLDSRNASGVGVGFMGDGFKLGGGRWVEGLSADRQLPSPLGGLQGGQGMLFGRPYSPGSWADYLVEAYAGPHDYLNSGRWYDNASGNAFNLTGFARAAGEALNVSNVVVATPFVAASVIPTYAYSPTLKF